LPDALFLGSLDWGKASQMKIIHYAGGGESHRPANPSVPTDPVWLLTLST